MYRNFRLLLVLATTVLTLLGLQTASGGYDDVNGGVPATNQVNAARVLLDSLDPDQVKLGSLPFKDPSRLDWHFFPKQRAGLPFSKMSLAQRISLQKLLRSALSEIGTYKANAIIQLEDVLREMARRNGRDDPSRDPGLYTLCIYGQPQTSEPWGWRVEGHHLSVNMTLIGDEVAGCSPAFFGVSPAVIPLGPNAGMRLLEAEEEMAHSLVETLSEKQRELAITSETPPRDIIIGPGKSLPKESDGIIASQLDPGQRALLRALVRVYANNLRPELAEEELRRIAEAGEESIRFSWSGPLERGQRHWYRIHGPTFIVELDRTQAQPGHIHAVWRDPARDFGLGPLQAHLQQNHRSDHNSDQ